MRMRFSPLQIFQSYFYNSGQSKPQDDGNKEMPDKKVKLPQKCFDIVRRADVELDRSSKRALLEQLMREGVPLDNNRKKYWVDSENRNCFILFARDLSVTWGGDSNFWRWPKRTVTFAPYISESRLAVAELVQVTWLEVTAELDASYLTPGVTYEVVFKMNLQRIQGFDENVTFSLNIPGQETEIQDIKLPKCKEWEWKQQVKTSPNQTGNMTITLTSKESKDSFKKGLIIYGVLITPLG